MKTPRIIFIVILLTNMSVSSMAQTGDLSVVKEEIKEAALKEQSAFKEGKCSEVMALMEDEITFLANGRKVPSKAVVEKFCNSLPRPFNEPNTDNLEIFALTKDSGYTIRTLEYQKDKSTNVLEYVTKIWRKSNGEWKISHLHSTVKQSPASD